MSIKDLNYYLPIIYEQHLESILERGPRSLFYGYYQHSYNLSCLSQQEKDNLLDELFETRKDFMYQYIKWKEADMNIDWVYNKKGLLEELVSYLNIQYRRQKIFFWIKNNQVIIRQFYVDKMISPNNVLKFYLDTKYKDVIDPLTQEFFKSLIVQK